MLDGLFGSKSVEKILLFLFVNQSSYGLELKRSLNIALTPIQKALNRLENGDILISRYEGKTRLYQFNLNYPLMRELEELLKTAYTLMSMEEKKNYCAIQVTKSSDNQHSKEILESFWSRLIQVKELTFESKAKLKEERGRIGKGKGTVSLEKILPNVLLFQEKGIWKDKTNESFNFSNAFRWTLDLDMGVIGLEHLRRGIDRPTFLFHLAPTGNQTLASVSSHLCNQDTYFGTLIFNARKICLNWRIIGPRKNEEIDYTYV